MEYSAEQIKDLYCKFKCPIKQSIKHIINNIDYWDDYNFIEEDILCEVCQIDSFIKELQDYKKI